VEQIIEYLRLDQLAGRASRERRGQMMETKEGAEKPEDLVAQALRLTDLVDYQAGSVVSREILKKDAGNVTLFAFDAGQGLSEHTAPYDAFVYIFDGEAAVSVSGKPHNVKKGELFIMPAGKPHELRAVTKYKMMLVMIKS
jgi:quercetin dioxygenase-like cupin family protein